MNAPGPDPGWNFPKALGMAVMVLLMGGFGLFALCGVAISLDSGSDGGMLELALACALAGAAIVTGAAFGARAILRSTRRRPPAP